MMMTLHGLLPIPQALYSKIEELTCMDLYLCDFDRCDTLVLILYGDVIFSIGCPRQLMMWCPLILAHDADLEDDGVWHVAFVPERYSFIFTGGHHSLEDQDVVIAWVTGSLQMTVVDSGTTIGTDLQVADLVELQRESTGVDVNTFLVKREC
jgi:hypothetical protein